MIPPPFPRPVKSSGPPEPPPDPQKAFSRALTEVAQLAGDFNTGANYVASGLPKFSTLESGAVLSRNRKTACSIASLPNLSNNNIRIEVENCIASALSKRHGGYRHQHPAPETRYSGILHHHSRCPFQRTGSGDQRRHVCRQAHHRNPAARPGDRRTSENEQDAARKSITFSFIWEPPILP